MTRLLPQPSTTMWAYLPEPFRNQHSKGNTVEVLYMSSVICSLQQTLGDYLFNFWLSAEGDNVTLETTVVSKGSIRYGNMNIEVLKKFHSWSEERFILERIRGNLEDWEIDVLKEIKEKYN